MEFKIEEQGKNIKVVLINEGKEVAKATLEAILSKLCK